MLRKFIPHARFINATLRQLRSILLPSTCFLCGYAASFDSVICSPCRNDLTILSHGCQICAQFLASSQREDLICGACLKNKPPFDRVCALFPYEPPAANFIIKLKFQHDLCMATLLGKLLSERIQTTWYQAKPLPDLIIPVPLHAHRLRERGFNQALEIAKIIGKTLAIPVDCRGTARIKETAAQSGLSAQKRKQNMMNAFIAHRDYADLTLAVVDDVMTTGHTITAFCQLLKQQQAKKIDIWCAARRR